MTALPEAPAHCHVQNGRCCTYLEGHRMHPIHARYVGRTPWGWRDGTVLAVDGNWLTVLYTRHPGSVRLWHHQSLGAEAAAGTRVRVHEEYHALGGPFGWVNVLVVGGAGAVAEPRLKRRWRRRVSVPVTDLATGRAIGLDHPEHRA